MAITKKFDMQFIRYMNLFGRVTRVIASHCFAYNNMLVFVVPREFVQQAIGRNNSNLKTLSNILGKRIRVVSKPDGLKDLKNFVSTIVSPIEFDKVEIVESPETRIKDAVITTSNRESKAMLIGRDRARESELKAILEQYFEIKNLRIN